MANIPLQSISFPGLSDKYTTPTVDATLTQTGAAADAKKTGDEIGAIKNDLSEKADKTDALSAYIVETETGAVASFTDGADDVPVKDMTVAIEPVQSGSGDPSPSNVRPISGWTGAITVLSPEAYLAKDFTGDGYKDQYRLISDGSEVATGGYRISGYIAVPANTPCFVSAFYGLQSPSICFYDANKEFISGISYNSRRWFTATTPNNCAYCRITLFISDHVAYDKCGIYLNYQQFSVD